MYHIIIIMYICNMEKHILNRIKVVLVEKEISQTNLATKLGKGRVTVNRYCSNEKQPSLEILKKIADILEVSMCDLLVER